MKRNPIQQASIRYYYGIMVVWLLFLASPVQGQMFESLPPHIQQEYGITFGVTSSDFTQDSSGYSPVALPFAGAFLSFSFHDRLELQGRANLFIKGANHNTPYWRNRYTYLGLDFSAHYRIFGFVQIGAVYRYHLEQRAQRVLLSGASSTGVIREEVPGTGNFGQALASLRFNFADNTSIFFQYGIPSQEIPFSHFQVGVRLNLARFSDPARFQVQRTNQSIAKDHAMALRNGLLLVRLRSMHNSLQLLEERGLFEEAERLRRATQHENQELVNAFSLYNYSRVLFFYDYHAHLVRDGLLDTILLNPDFEPVTPDTPIGSIYIAYLGSYSSSDTIYHIQHDLQYLKENEIALDSSAAYIQYISQSTRVGGIVITDQQFNPVPKPFPVFTPALNPTIFRSERRLERTVTRLNESLIRLLFDE